MERVRKMLIVCAAVLAVGGCDRGRATSVGAPDDGRTGPTEFPMKCVSCGYEWTATRSELVKLLYQESMPLPDPNSPPPGEEIGPTSIPARPPRMVGPMSIPAGPPVMVGPPSIPARPPGVKCPKCHAKQSVYPMTECPNCHKFFLSARISDPNAMLNPQFKDECPYCHTDINEYFRNKQMGPAGPNK